MNGRKLTEAETKEYHEHRTEDADERARHAVDACFHGIAIGLIDEEVMSKDEAHRFVAQVMIQELLDHGFDIITSDGEGINFGGLYHESI